jgi:hypothetical protein
MMQAILTVNTFVVWLCIISCSFWIVPQHITFSKDDFKVTTIGCFTMPSSVYKLRVAEDSVVVFKIFVIHGHSTLQILYFDFHILIIMERAVGVEPTYLGLQSSTSAALLSPHCNLEEGNRIELLPAHHQQANFRGSLGPRPPTFH